MKPSEAGLSEDAWELLETAESRGIRRQCRYAAMSKMLELQTVAVQCARAKQVAQSLVDEQGGAEQLADEC